MMCDILPYLQHARQTGRTTALACAAQMIGAIFVVATINGIARIKRQFPGLNVKAASESSLIGTSRAIILDHLVVELMIEEALDGNQAEKARKYDKIVRVVSER